MAVLAPFLVLFGFILGIHKVEPTQDTLDSLESSLSDSLESFCHGGLEVNYPELDIDKCLIIPKDLKLREKISTVWKAPQVYFSGAQKLAEPSSIAQAALQEQRLAISPFLNPSRVHSEEKMYVLVMVDPDAPSRTKQTSAYWRHWLVVNIKGNALKKGKLQGTALTEYHPPTPPQKTGFHRYQFILFEQPPHTPVSLADQERSSRGKWDFQAFITRFGLGEPVASLQFLTQNFKD